MQLKVGTLYGALDRLAEEGLIAPDREEVEAGRLSRYYRLADEGAAQLAAHTQRLAKGVATATARLRARGVALPGLGNALGNVAGTA